MDKPAKEGKVQIAVVSIVVGKLRQVDDGKEVCFTPGGLAWH